MTLQELNNELTNIIFDYLEEDDKNVLGWKLEIDIDSLPRLTVIKDKINKLDR